ncbi:discoidin domain-containing protein [Faecalimonas sp.]
MKKKQVVSGLLSAAMVMNVALVDMGPVQAATQTNLALGCSAVASNVEDDNHSAAKAVDGDLNTWWSTKQNKAKDEHIEVSLDGVKTVKQINIHFEREDAKQNIKKFKVEIKNDKEKYETVYESKNERAKNLEVIKLQTAKKAKAVKVTILDADGGTLNWVNVGIREIEVFENEQKDIVSTKDVNHVKSAEMVASSVEKDSNGKPHPSLVETNANDGKENTRWASDYTEVNKQSLTAKFSNPTSVKHVRVRFHKRDVNPGDSNVEQFKLKYKDINGEEKEAKQVSVSKLGDNRGYATEVDIVLENPIVAQELKISDFVANATEYNNISVVEFEAYSNQQSQKPSENTLDGVIAGLQGGTVAKDAKTFTLPTVPQGFTIKINGADFEQIIAKDGKVQHPLTDKLVKVSFEVSDNKGNSKVTGDYDYTVKGLHEKVNGKNAKPVVIPEIQEWYSDSDKKVSTANLTKVVYNDEKLKPIVDEFVKD